MSSRFLTAFLLVLFTDAVKISDLYFVISILLEEEFEVLRRHPENCAFMEADLLQGVCRYIRSGPLALFTNFATFLVPVVGIP